MELCDATLSAASFFAPSIKFWVEYKKKEIGTHLHIVGDAAQLFQLTAGPPCLYQLRLAKEPKAAAPSLLELAAKIFAPKTVSLR